MKDKNAFKCFCALQFGDSLVYSLFGACSALVICHDDFTIEVAGHQFAPILFPALMLLTENPGQAPPPEVRGAKAPLHAAARQHPSAN